MHFALKRGTRLAHGKGCRVRVQGAMKGDERLERAKKRSNEHLAKLVKANMEKTEAEKKAKLDKDIEVDTGVGEEHGALSSTEMPTGWGIKRDIDTDHGDAMTDEETTGKRMRVKRVVELVPASRTKWTRSRWTKVGVAGWRPTSGWSKTGRRMKSSPRPWRRKLSTWWKS